MTQLIKFNETQNYVTSILKAKKWFSFYVDGKKYFFFCYRSKIYCISEFLLGLIFCSLAFFGTLLIRKLIKRFQIKKKLIPLIKRLRAGETNLVSYERLSLTSRQEFMKDLLKHLVIALVAATLIDCADSLKELPKVDRTYVESTIKVEPTSSRISYTRENPIKQEMYVSTDPNSNLYYQKDVEIETLDGNFKEQTRLNGKTSIEWCPNREKKSHNPTYIPLEARTKTLSDLEKLNTTINRKSASKIVERAQKE